MTTRDPKFWIPMIVFQILFGLAIFGLTRDYYVDAPDRSGAPLPTVDRSTNSPPSAIPQSGFTRAGSPAVDGFASRDPAELSRQADEHFERKEYETAADLYARLLQISPNDVDTHNNLGLTLHYLNRSTDALRTLNEGVAIDPENQRIWLTLGYVNSELGHFEQASKALTNATLIGNDESIRKSAMEMIRDLP